MTLDLTDEMDDDWLRARRLKQKALEGEQATQADLDRIESLNLAELKISMKTIYEIIIGVLFILALAAVYYIVSSPAGSETWLGNAIQSAAVFAALLASVIALSATDPRLKEVKVKIEPGIGQKFASYKKTSLPSYLQNKYTDYPDPITTHQVQFKITNTSGFDLKRPILTFRLPIEKMHPYPVSDDTWILSFNSNLFNSQSELRVLEFADTRILSNSNLPIWNKEEDLTIWIRMLINDGKLKPFTVQVSVNCENAEGISRTVSIDPKKLLENARKGDLGPRESTKLLEVKDA